MSEPFEFPFNENYEEVDGVRLHYVDESSGPPILMVHGQPTSSYLYRKMIPPLVAAGYRCVAPDLMGFGLSDKPTDEKAYTLRRHVELVTGLVEKLELEGITTVGQDWGGPITLRYAIDHQDNVRALVILNTLVRLMPIPLFFNLMFRSGGFSSFLVRRLDLFRKMAFGGGLMFKRPLDRRAKERYKMPHPSAASRAGIAAFPKMTPTSANHPNAEYISEIDATLQQWDIPVLVMFSDKDIAFKVEEGQRIAGMVPNGRFEAVRNAGHYLQEDAGEEIAERMVTFLRDEAKITGAWCESKGNPDGHNSGRGHRGRWGDGMRHPLPPGCIWDDQRRPAGERHPGLWLHQPLPGHPQDALLQRGHHPHGLGEPQGVQKL